MKIKKVLVTEEGKKFYAEDLKKNLCTQYGSISFDQLDDDSKDKVSTNKGKEMFIFPAGFLDNYKRMGRGPQIISLKDIGSIMAYTAVGKDSTVADAGVGTGGVSCFLARYVKHVYAFDRKPSSIKTAKDNAELLGLNNISFFEKNIYEDELGIDPVDLFVLDVPDPDVAIKNIEKTIKRGGYLIAYSPNVSQVQKMVHALPDSLNVEKTLENIERLWNVDKERSRPMTKDFAHTGFLTFIRKVK